MPHDVPILVPTVREQALRKDETRIRSLAGQLANADPQIAVLHDAVIIAEDFFDLFETYHAHFATKPNSAHLARSHDIRRRAAHQLKMLLLDRLAHLVI